MRYEEMRKQWEEILERVERVGGESRMEIGPPATEEEVRRVEERLGKSLPDSFRCVLLGFSKEMEVWWFFPDSLNVPNEFREISWGQIGWSLAELERYAEDEPVTEWGGKLPVFTVPNGDQVMLEPDGQVWYWGHDSDEEWLPLAPDFGAYLRAKTDLFLAGSEWWELKPFLGSGGLDAVGKPARRWRRWFLSHTDVDLEKIRSNPAELIDFLLEHPSAWKKEMDILRKLDPEAVLEHCLVRLAVADGERAWRLCRLIREALGRGAGDEVRKLWQERTLPSEPLSYLAARCLPAEEGLSRVTAMLEERWAEIPPEAAFAHLKHFRSRRVILWMKGKVRHSTVSWGALFARSNPSWEDVKKWLESGNPYRQIVLSALRRFVDELYGDRFGLPEGEEPYQLLNPPTREEFVRTMERIRSEAELSQTRKQIDRLLESAGRFCREG